jgi:hypothetical protein
MPRNLIHLWDYGWLDRDEVAIPSCETISEVIAAYIRSESFGTSFVGPRPDLTPELHGPFRRSAVSEADFVSLSSSEFLNELRTLCQPDGFTSAADNDQWRALEHAASEFERNHSWIIMLCLTEKHCERFHEWGSVLYIFREFLFANPYSERLSRFIVGYD